MHDYLQTPVDEADELVDLLVETSGRGTLLLRTEGADTVTVDSVLGECLASHTTALCKPILLTSLRPRETECCGDCWAAVDRL